jgi:hypothetical protein
MPVPTTATRVVIVVRLSRMVVAVRLLCARRLPLRHYAAAGEND